MRISGREVIRERSDLIVEIPGKYDDQRDLIPAQHILIFYEVIICAGGFVPEIGLEIIGNLFQICFQRKESKGFRAGNQHDIIVFRLALKKRIGIP